MNALARTFSDLAEALASQKQRFFVVKQRFGNSALSGKPTHTADVFDRETGKTWRCHGHQLQFVLSGEEEPDEDWLTLIDEPEDVPDGFDREASRADFQNDERLEGVR
ncbi:hypothetical protein [Chelativorans xinjiangense]|uniref:hypothetical protein n=1 Tax=Chelativorans xinjiangense TaxID=2681485 RepID=UPI0013572062|nr:hypothetical protein [Chelativorans xinjiangense]